MKRMIAIVIALVLCLSVVPMAALAETNYFVAGSAGLCGSEWAVDDSMNAMTVQDDGTYAITYPNVAVGTYQFKVTAGNWENAWGKDGQNVSIEVTAVCNVTINFNPETQEVGFSGDSVRAVSDLLIESMRAVGNGSVDWLNGAAWDPAADANTMTASGNVYTITYKNVPAGSDYQFKFAANGGWNDNWGLPTGTVLEIGTPMDAVYNSQNITLSLSEAADVTLTLDLSGFDYASKTGAKLTVTTTAASGGSVETPTEATEPTETIKVYAHVPESWAAPGVWAWDDNQKNAFKAWPGLAMTEGEDGWWYAEVPAWVQNIIINANNGSSQTADLDMEQQADMWIPVRIENNVLVADIYYEKPDLSQLTPPTEAVQPTTEATEPVEETEPETQPSDPAQGEDPADPGAAGNVVLWVVVLVLSAGVGVGAVLLIHYIRNKKKA